MFQVSISEQTIDLFESILISEECVITAEFCDIIEDIIRQTKGEV